jgi:exodeoxyribonuclease V alpha subunit
LNWDGDLRWLAESGKARAEAQVAKIANRMAAFGVMDAEIPDGLSWHQAQVATAVLVREIGILGGGPGTGKTFTAAKIIGQAIEKFGKDKIAVGAPTGKASVTVTEALNKNGINLTARTWHSLLKVSQLSEVGGWTFEHDESNPLPYRFLVGDESSMLDTTMMWCVLRAIEKGCRLLLVGDVQQLPPVGHGAPLRDMILAGLPYGELTEIRRNSGHIVKVCSDIRNNHAWDGVNEVNLNDGDNLQVIDSPSPAHQIGELVDQLRMLATSFNPVWDCQVIVPVNKKSPLARTKLNQVLQVEFNANPLIPGNPFRLDDKVVNTRNCYLDVVDEDGGKVLNGDGEPVRAYVANGEIGRVVLVWPKRLLIKLESPDRLVLVPRGKSDEENGDGPNTGCSWDLAYAISCHKSQGSEWPVAIVMLDEYPGAMRVADRAWLYTAISRAKKLCLLIGKKATADAMCRRTNIESRKTFLRELLTK